MAGVFEVSTVHNRHKVAFRAVSMSQPQDPKLQFLHPATSFIQTKLQELRRLPTEALKSSLLPGQRDCLKTRRDGTILDGHHRIAILLERGEEVHRLPREIIEKQDES
jgi:hypothetical protein